MKFIIIPKEVYDMIPENKRIELGISSPRMSVDESEVILHIEHYNAVFNHTSMKEGEESSYPYPVYDNPSTELSSILSSKSWSPVINNE